MAAGMREWMALVVTLAMLLAAATGYRPTTTPCQEAYLMSGLSEQQMSFEEFREFHSGSVCVRGGDGASLAG
jgi:hypothetical protein